MKKIEIENIKDAGFLKKLSHQELENLSSDIKEFLVDSVSKTGGHLSSNLGVVDLTVSLHKSFNFKKDKIIFDVGHQSYTHKILTGRAKEFKSLRKFGGLSGFQALSEGDDYESGHSSTSLSAALGFAISRDMSNKKHHVVAVIGDASISNGLSCEAINHIGASNTKLIIVLNDNGLSIGQNVGALHNLFDKIRSNSKYSSAKDNTKSVLNKIPFAGSRLVKFTSITKRAIKSIFIKDGSIFESLNITYLGPINGHDYYEMEKYFSMAKKVSGPVIVHVITVKGLGYKFSENDVTGAWHGVGPFDKTTGAIKEKHIYADVISKELFKLAKANKDIIAITAAMTNGSKLKNFRENLPKQFIDVGIAEEHALVLSNSLALDGKKPVIFLYSSFLQRGYDQIVHDIAKMKSGVLICIDRAGVIGEDGASHQGLFDVSMLLSVPNMVVACPSNASEALGLLKLGLKSKLPFALRYSKNEVDSKYAEKEIKFGSWKRLTSGKSASIITYGDFVQNALNIAKVLEKEGIYIEVINAVFIKPIDEVMLKSITNETIFVYEEATKIGSLGSYLSTFRPVDILAVEDQFVKHGKRSDVLKDLSLDEDSVIKYIKSKLNLN